MPQNKLYN